jgi:hypothetical protein
MTHTGESGCLFRDIDKLAIIAFKISHKPFKRTKILLIDQRLQFTIFQDLLPVSLCKNKVFLSFLMAER